MNFRLSEPSRLAASVEAALDGVEESLTLDDNRAAVLLVGNYDQNIAHLERRLNVLAHVNGNQIRLRGTRDAVNHARRVIENLYAAVRKGRTVGVGDVDGAIEETALQRALFPVKSEDHGAVAREIHARFRACRHAQARTGEGPQQRQDAYLRVLARHELVFAEGPAGTGKTWLAVGHAVQLLEAGHVERLILSRPAVEAGEKIGFLPGDMREKVDPYLRPIYDALYDFMEGGSSSAPCRPA